MNFLNHYFKQILLLIILLGFLLRFHSYASIPPFGETKDEFLYPWVGISLLKTGIPTSWSNFVAYPQGEYYTFWGESFRLVSPWLEKPPLYSLIVGAFSILAGQDTFAAVRLSTIRLVPLFLSLATLSFLGLLTKKVYGEKTALLTTLLYATIPTMVMANRMSLVENLLVPIVLGTLYAYEGLEKRGWIRPAWVILGCVLAVLTKQIGIVLPGTIVLLLLSERRWKFASIVALASLAAFAVNPLLGFLSDWPLYNAVMSEFSRAHLIGLPETISTLFRIPGIGHKESIFLDPWMLAGFIVLLAGAFQAYGSHSEHAAEMPNVIRSDKAILFFPFLYLLTLSLLEGGTTWYGWHLFPLYPFMAIQLAISLKKWWQERTLPQFIFFLIVIVAGSVRWLFLLYPNLPFEWQKLLGVVAGISVLVWLTHQPQLQKRWLWGLIIALLFINIFVVLNLSALYPMRPQPI